MIWRGLPLLLLALAPLPGTAVNQPLPPGPAPVAQAQPRPEPAAPETHAAPQVPTAILTRIPGARAENLRPTDVPGIWELTRGAEVSYVSADGKYMFGGDLFKVASAGDMPNLSEVRRRELRAHTVEALADDDLIVFGPDDARYTVTVFTDVDCQWCRRLHSQIPDYNRLGVKLRYAAWPRSGPASESWIRAQVVWCAQDRGAAYSNAQPGRMLKGSVCNHNPVQRQWNLGKELGVRGTPALVLPDGEIVNGYLAPNELMRHLQRATAAR